MILFILLQHVLASLPESCKFTDEDGNIYDLNKLRQPENYKIKSNSGAMMFEFNFCSTGVQCQHREQTFKRVAAFQTFHNKCYTIGTKESATVRYDNGIILNYKKGDLCGETQEYQVQFYIQCGEEEFHQVVTHNPCDIHIQGMHKAACKPKSNTLYYIIIGLIICFGVYKLLQRFNLKSSKGYTFV